MNKLITILTIVLLATTVQASSNVELFAKDTSTETSLCLIAGQNGFQAAKAEAKKLGAQFKSLNFLCNGLSVKEFSKTYNSEIIEQAKPIVLVPANQTVESQLCIEAAKNGIQSIGREAQALTCNGDSVARFVRKVNNS